MLTDFELEELENKYLEKFYHFLKYTEDEMLKGFQTKEKIKNDWIKYWKLSGWKNAVKYKPIIKYIKFVIKYVTHFRLYDNRNKLFIKESYELA